jgi:hypothetical protein
MLTYSMHQIFQALILWACKGKIMQVNTVFLLLPSSFSLCCLLPPLGGLKPFKQASALSDPLSGIGGLRSGGERSKKPPK